MTVTDTSGSLGIVVDSGLLPSMSILRPDGLCLVAVTLLSAVRAHLMAETWLSAIKADLNAYVSWLINFIYNSIASANRGLKADTSRQFGRI